MDDHPCQNSEAVAERASRRGRVDQVDEDIDPLLLDPQGGHLGEGRRLDLPDAA
jgi:hypothetical protein